MTISDGEICIGSITIRTDQVKLVTVRGKTRGNLLFMFYAYESCSVLLDNGEEHSIAVENYLNGNVIRMNFDRLNRFVLGKSVKFSVVENDEEYQFGHELPDTRTAIKYMQSPFKSFNNYFFGGICLGAIWMMVQMKYTSPFVVLFPVGMFALFYFVLVIQNHYFLLTNTHLVVRSLFLPTWQRVFRLDNINNIGYAESEDIQNTETALKLMTKNFRIYRFQSGLMNEEMFHDLIQAVNRRQAESGQNRS